MGINVKILCQSLLVAEGLSCLLDTADQVDVVGVASSLDDLLKHDTDSCDVLVADVDSAHDVFGSMERLGGPHVLLVSNKTDDPYIYEDLKDHVAAGLSGIMATDSDHILFEKAILKINSGELWIDHMTLSKSLTKEPDHRKDVQITKKEAEVLEYVCTGDTNKKIAQKLCISEQTVKSHCNHLFKKFGVENRVKLVLSASKMLSSHRERSKSLQ
jgi:DNA-binding NarL/FixJ family response regulator